MKSFLLGSLFLLLALPLQAFPLLDADDGLSAAVPTGWLLYRKGEDKGPARFTYSYSLPAIMDKTANQKVPNSVSVMILDAPIDSLSKLLEIEKEWAGKRLLAARDIKSDLSDAARTETVTNQGFTYVTRVDFFLRKKTGYIVVFTSTQGTFEQNLPQVLEFLKSIKALGRPN